MLLLWEAAAAPGRRDRSQLDDSGPVRRRHSPRIDAISVEYIGEGYNTDDRPRIGPAHYRQHVVPGVAHPRQRQTERLIAVQMRNDRTVVRSRMPCSFEYRRDGYRALRSGGGVDDVAYPHHAEQAIVVDDGPRFQIGSFGEFASFVDFHLQRERLWRCANRRRHPQRSVSAERTARQV